jgi:hypothetical protein
VTKVVVDDEGRSALLTVDGLVQGHVHEFDMAALRSGDGEPLLHSKAYYTLNEIPGTE